VASDGAPHREFRRGFAITPGERVLLVDDILTTGGSLLAMIPAVEAAGGEIVECAVLVDRSGGRATLVSPASGRVYPLRALWQLELPTYEPGAGSCPRCAAGEPAVKPGSSGTGRPCGRPGGRVGRHPSLAALGAAAPVAGHPTAPPSAAGSSPLRGPDRGPCGRRVSNVGRAPVPSPDYAGASSSR
jgi:hypothetical protein